jgi:chitin disaccharide deacetylase
MSKYLIINADDFGMSEVFNEVILDLIKKDLIRSTTVMINRVTESQKKQLEELTTLAETSNLSIGLHIEFKDSDYPTQIKSQYKKFKDILGFRPSHIDIHKAHGLTDSFSDVSEFCRENNLPLRNSGVFHQGIKSTYTEAFFGSIADFNDIKKWVNSFKGEKYYEILFHPGQFDPNCESSLNKDRERDVKHIHNLNKMLKEKNIKLVSYLDLASSDSYFERE